MIPIHLSAVTLKSSWVYLSAIQSGRYFLLTAEVLGLTVENVFSKLFLIHSEKKKGIEKNFFSKVRSNTFNNLLSFKDRD